MNRPLPPDFDLDDAFSELLAHPDLPRDRRILLLLGSGRFSEAVLQQALSRPKPAKAKAAELRVRKNLVAAYTLSRERSSVAAFSEGNFPREALVQTDALREEVQLQRSVEDYILGPALKEALDWADQTLNLEPELALRLCTSEEGAAYMAIGCSAALHPMRERSGAKRQEKRFDQRLARFGAFSQHVAGLVAANPSLSDDELVVLAAEEVFGGLQAIMLHCLACHHYGLVRLVTAVFLGVAPHIKGLASRIDVDDVAFVDSALERCGLMDILAFDGPFIAELLFDAQELAEKYHRQWAAYSNTAHHIKRILEQHGEAEKAHAQELNALSRQLKEQATTIQRLSAGTAGAAEQALRAELKATQEQLARVREEAAQKDAHIAQLRRKVAEQTVPSSPATVAPPPATLPAPAPEPAPPRMTYEEALAQLRSLRGALVGGHSTFHQKVKELLPEWALYDSKEKSVDEGVVRGAEALVLFTSHCNHPLTTRVIALARAHRLPLVYATKVNPPAFVLEVADKLPRTA